MCCNRRGSDRVTGAPMSLVERVHGRYVHVRRVRRLCELIARQLPPNASVLDVGAGDGWLDQLILEQRPDVQIHGVDVLVREGTHVPVSYFDGIHLPSADQSYDVVLFVDVLHHTEDPMILLREATRVARQAIVIKDHTTGALCADTTLRFMDRVSNRRHGVALPHNYWRPDQWRAAFETLGLAEVARESRLGLYPWPASLIFDRNMQFIARLDTGPRSL
jgi:SAM-dependent methyltransferase